MTNGTTAKHDFTISFDWDDMGSVYITNPVSGTFEKRVVLRRKAASSFGKFLKALGKQMENEADDD